MVFQAEGFYYCASSREALSLIAESLPSVRRLIPGSCYQWSALPRVS